MSGKDTSTSPEVSPYVSLLKIHPNNYQRWVSEYQIHAKAKFGIFSKVFSTLEEPVFDYAKEFKVKADNPLKAKYDEKSIDTTIAYNQSKPKIFGDLMMHISPDSTIRVKNHDKYKAAVEADDVIELWKIISICHITNQSTKSTQVHAEQNVYRDMKQGNMGIEKYNDKFKFQVQKLVELGKTPPEDEAVNTYLYSLSGVFVEVAKKMLKDSSEYPLPGTLVEATAAIAMWYETEIAVNKAFGIPAPNANTSAPKQETALVAAGAAGANADAKAGGGKENKRNKQHKKKRQGGGEGGTKEGSAEKEKSKKDCAWCKSHGKKAFDTHDLKDCNFLKRHMKEESESSKSDTQPRAVNAKLALQSPAAADMADAMGTFDWPDEINIHGHVATTRAVKCNWTSKDGVLTLVFDTGTTAIIVRDKCLLTDMKKLTKPVLIHGVSGDMYAYEMGIMGPFGPALYVPDSPTNLISWAEMSSRGFTRTFDEKKDAFVVQRGATRYAFELCKNKSDPYYNLYVLRLNKPSAAKVVQANHVFIPASALAGAAQVVNDQIFTTREIVRAKAARLLHQQLDHISDHNLSALLNSGGILNCPTTALDVRNAAKILGACPDCMLGKMTEPIKHSSTRPTCESIAEVLNP